MTQQHDQLDMTRDRLKQWGAWLQSTEGVFGGVIATYDERSSVAEGLVLMGDDEVAERAERILCRIKQQHPRVYRVLWLWYYAEANWHQIADSMKAGVPTVRVMRKEGELLFAAYWDAGYGETETGASLKKSA